METGKRVHMNINENIEDYRVCHIFQRSWETVQTCWEVKRPDAHCTGVWVGPRARVDLCGKSRPTGIRSPDRPSRSKLL